MAEGIKISEMAASVAVNGDEIIPVIQGGVNKRTTLTQIKTFLEGLFLGKTAVAADSSKLGGVVAANYMLTATRISGYVWWDGAAVSTPDGTDGGRFAINRDGVGTYTITYTPSFSGNEYPAVAFTPLGGIEVPVITGLSNTMTTVKFYNLNGQLQDTGFTFIAVK